MLDQLVESRSNSNNQKSRSGYLFTTGFLVFSLFASGILWSLFAQNLDIGSDSLELSSIVPPVPMPDEVPPAPEPIQPTKQVSAPKQNETNIFVRKENVANINESQPTPKEISTSPNTQASRPNTAFKIGNVDKDPPSGVGGFSREGTGNTGGPIGVAKPKSVEIPDDEVPPPVAKKPEPKVEKPKPTSVSKGVINGSAISLPKPPYPAPAKAIRASGEVSVQVTIDEKGNVISANAVSGHTLLRKVSEDAAKLAKFKPTLLSDVPVKVTGIIVYKFAVQ